MMKYFLVFFLSLQIQAGLLDVFLPGFRTIQVPAEDNNCFFNALRRANIDINRNRVIEQLERHRLDPVWVQAVARLAAQELETLNFDDFRLRDLQQRARYNRERVVQDESDYLYEWFIQRLRLHAPMPYERDDLEEGNPIQLMDLLGEVFRFNLRIVQVTGAQQYRLMRNFCQDNQYPEVTLRHTAGEVGHFEYLVEQEQETYFNNVFSKIKVPYVFEDLCAETSLGTFGAAMLAYPFLGLDQPCVIKIPSRLARAPHEGLMHAKLQHCPWVATLRELFFHEDGRQSLVMPRYWADLFKTMTTGTLIFRQLAAAQMILALHHLHTLGVTHNDIKLENFLVDGNKVVLADFGAAAVVGATIGRVGTEDYMPPETMDNMRSRLNSEAQDRWGLGVVLYCLFGQRHPFNLNKNTARAGTFIDLSSRITRLEPCIHNSQRQCIRGLLSLEPSERWSTGQVLSSDFGAYLLKIARDYLRSAEEQRALDIAELFAGLRTEVHFETHQKCGTAWNPCRCSVFIDRIILKTQLENMTLNGDLEPRLISQTRFVALPDAPGFGLEIRLESNYSIYLYVDNLETLHVLLDSIKKTQNFVRTH